MHAWPEVICVELSEILVLRLPVLFLDESIATIPLVPDAEENEQLADEDAHIKQEGGCNRVKLVICHLVLVVKLLENGLEMDDLDLATI